LEVQGVEELLEEDEPSVEAEEREGLPAEVDAEPMEAFG